LNTGRWFWLGIGSTAALAGFVLALMRDPPPPAPRSPVQLAKAPQPNVVVPEPAIHVEAQRLASWSDNPTNHPSDGTGHEEAPPTAAGAGLVEGASQAEPTSDQPRRRDRLRAAHAAEVRAARGAHRRENRLRAAAEAAAAASVNPPLRAQKDAPRRAPAEPPKLSAVAAEDVRGSQDMRAFNNRGRRPIDIEDPFQ
jgi:hypothetical protein